MQDKIPLPAGILFYLILALIVAGLAWMYIMPVEETVTAAGYVDFSGQSYAVSAPVSGTVKTLHVQSSEAAAEGDILLTVAAAAAPAEIDREPALKEVEISAPTAGILLWQREIIRGDMVQSGERLAVIYPPEPIGITVMLSEQDMGRVHIGLPVRIRVNAFPYQEFGILTGKVRDYKLLNAPERHLVLSIEMTNIPENMKLMPGMGADVDIITGRSNMLSQLF